MEGQDPELRHTRLQPLEHSFGVNSHNLRHHFIDEFLSTRPNRFRVQHNDLIRPYSAETNTLRVHEMRCVAPTLRRLDRSLTSFRPSTLRTVPTRALPHAQHIRLQGCLLRGSSIRPQPYHHVSTQLQLRSLCGIPSILLPPVVFAGLMVVLWTWKCFMMVLFQNKIIYMPFLPPNARRETITDYASQCSGMKWREERIRSGDRTKISLCIAVVQNIAAQSASEEEVKEKTVLYFQGR